MVKKKIMSVMLILIILFQLFMPMLSCYAMEDEITNREIEVISEGNTEPANDEKNEIVKEHEEDEKIDENDEDNSIKEEITVDNEFEDDFEETNEDIESEEIKQEGESIEEAETEGIQDLESEEMQKVEEVENLEVQETMADSTENEIVAYNLVRVGNEAEFRSAYASGATEIYITASIDFSSPLSIDRSVSIIDDNENNALRYAEGNSFITIQNGATLALSGIVVDTNSSGVGNMTAINIQSGGRLEMFRESIVDGGMQNTGILVNNGASCGLYSSRILRCHYGINVQETGTLGFGTDGDRHNSIYSNYIGVYVDNFSGNCNFDQSNIAVYQNTAGIFTANTGKAVNILAGEYYENMNAINCGGSINISGGNFHNNSESGILTNDEFLGDLTMTGGNIYDNGKYAIYHVKGNETGCGIYGGSVSGIVYLAQNDNFVNTNESYPTLTVQPSTQFFKRKLIRTANEDCANNEINHITPMIDAPWYMHVYGNDIVLWKDNDGCITINKTDKDTGAKLVNITFDILDEAKNVVDTVTTDESGSAVSKKLPMGQKYYVKETKTQENYYLNEELYEVDFTNELGNEENFTLNITNEHKKGNLAISKVDFDNQEQPVEKVTFELYAKKVDNYKENDFIGTYTTDKNGKIYVEGLWIGEYYLVESKTQKVYKLNTEKFEVTISDGVTSNMTILNEKKKDKIEITVKDKDTGEPLKDTTFDILDKDGNVIETLTTDEDGKATSKDLPIDEIYTVIQTGTQDNYIPSDEKIVVDFMKELGDKGDEIYPIDVTNKHKVGDILLKKVDFDDNNIALEGFAFELYVENVDKPYEKDQLMGTYTTNENGEIHIEQVWIGDYYLKEKETEASKYYRLIEDKLPVAVESDSVTEMTIENEKQKGQIEISKKIAATDSKITGEKAGSLLAGAIFAIYDKDSNEVARIVTDENGYAISEGLPLDMTYTIKEVQAPEWYVMNDRAETIEFMQDGEVVSLEWTNEAVVASLHIEQTGIVQTQANDMIRYDITKLENNSNVEVDNFTLEDHLPYEYTTLKSLYTGTYNYDRNYTVWYKVAGQEEWLQMRNENTEDGTYNTLKNNYIDFSNMVETITDFKIDFGTVEADFSAKVDDMPFVFVKVNDNVKNNEKWSNTVKLTGNYTSSQENTIDLEDTAEFETTVYAHKLDINDNQDKGSNNLGNVKRDVLPRTGM